MRSIAPLWFLAALAAGASAHTLTGAMYRTGGQTDGSNPRLYDVNPGTGALSNERRINVNFCVGIAASSDGRLYGLTDSFGRINNTPGQGGKSLLFSIDPGTGFATGIGRVDPTGAFGVNEGDLTFAPDGTLWGLSNRNGGAGADLFRIDPTTGLGSDFVTIPTANGDLTDASAMAFTPDGSLYVLDTVYPSATIKPYGARLLKVNPLTGSSSLVYQSSILMGGTAGMAYDAGTGSLLLTDGDFGGTNRLYRFDFASPGFTDLGAITTVGGTQAYMGGLAGLATPFAAPVPEPASLAVLGLGALACLRRRRER